jgi:hypothetical protein
VGGVKGAISTSNSLVGRHAYDNVGGNYTSGTNTEGLVLLANGNYVVVVPSYNSDPTRGIRGYGVVAWGSGTVGVVGTIGTGNALLGNAPGDEVGFQGVTTLPSGNYLVISPVCTVGSNGRAGAVTWGSGTAGVKGTVSASNSLVSSHSDNNVGGGGVLVLANGNYVVASPYWSPSGSAGSLGAVTWGSGTAGVKGTISASNSLVGSTAGDNVGFTGSSGGGDVSVYPLPNGNYLVFSHFWDNKISGTVTNAGALTLGDSNGGTVGPITGCNSIVGSVANQGTTLSFAYNPAANNLLGGLPAEKKVVVGVSAPAAPTGAATVADLQATGTTVQWYAASSGGIALASTMPLANGTTYYATQTVNGCESLSRLAVTAAAPLPVQFTAFTAALAGQAAVRLNWATASEKNSQAFEVERSLDGTAFVRIGTVATAGSSSAPRVYELLDEQLPTGTTQLYYRLRLLDQDGKAGYSPVRPVVLPGAATGLLLFPNPALGGTATLRGAAPGTAVTVMDALCPWHRPWP